MQSFLKKTVYAGLTLFALGSLAAVNTTTANAKKHVTTKRVAKKVKKGKHTKKQTKVTVTYYKVHFAENAAYAKSNGVVSIMNKPGKLGNAKVVANKTTMRRLAKSKLPENVFHVYGMAKTNTGLYYAHVVTLGGKYRGWIYVGKNDFQYNLDNITKNTGISATKTLRYGANPSNVNVKILDKLWTYPKFSRYNARVVSHKKASYINDDFVVESAVYNTRGWLYYYVQDAKKKSVNGWIYSGSTTARNAKKDTKKTSKKNPAKTSTDNKQTQSNPTTTKPTPSTYNLVFKYNGNFVSTKIVNLSDLSVNGTPVVTPDSIAKFIPSNYQITTDANAINTDGPIVNGGTAIINLNAVPATRLTIAIKQKDTGSLLTPSSDLVTTLNEAGQDLLNQKLVLNGQSINADAVKSILTNRNLLSIDQSKLSTSGAGSLQFVGVDTTAVDASNPTVTLYYK
ncbi:hypothetical protein LAKU_23c00100 [Apilactobacillus kunkeei EFB6]|uniref:S-layer protein n=1 Tax=Apilactobacillus kunkeei EFB6 TaxID=1419324 RepID=A0A836YUD0_9LACO|nr:hypothetical protein [Apilactobacillus kunkeei]KDB00473.1 hypothetical protein LAKU_23c00100 [Apilactobacillus kunkeei EFB6]